MKQRSFILLALSIMLSMSSCEWIGTKILGRPSKAELAKMAAVEQHRKDSIAEAERVQLSLAMEQQRVADSLKRAENPPLKGERFHIVLGCFKVHDNATRFMTRMEKEGFSPQKFNLNGFECISVASYKVRDDAYREIYRIMMNDYCPEDFWIYDTRTALHN